MAESPTVGELRREVNSRASPSDSRSPRFDITSACSSSRIDALERAEQERRVGGGEQQRELLGRGEQDVGRIAALALALRDRRVAGAGLDADRQPHLGDRPLEIARDVDRERLQRRDVERVQAAVRRIPRPVETQLAGLRAAERAASSTSVGRKPASVLPAPVGAISSAERPACACRAVRADARAASSRARQTSARRSRADSGRSARETYHRASPVTARQHQQPGHRHALFLARRACRRVETQVETRLPPSRAVHDSRACA